MSKADMDSTPTESIEVTIFNQTYRLRSKTDKEQVEEIARLVDERMRQIANQMTTHDPLKIAVLTALNIADEMQRLRDYYEREIQPLLARSAEDSEERLKEEGESDEQAASKSWFEDFFEAKVETKDRAERLSSQVSAKLQSLREPSSEQLGITSEDDPPI